MKFLYVLLTVFFFSCSNKIYVVRHAEKAPANTAPNGDVELSEAGKQRAKDLLAVLASKHIAEIYSTNTIRTRSTAAPTAEHFGLTTQFYGPRPDTAFINLLKTKKKNVLVVGHSNTIDDIANLLCGATVVPGDLPDAEYDNLFIITRKGKRYFFTGKKYGKLSK